MHSIKLASNWIGSLSTSPIFDMRDSGPMWLKLSFGAAAASSLKQLCLMQARFGNQADAVE